MKNHRLAIAALAALALPACQSGETIRIGYARTDATDDLDVLENLDVDQLGGIEAQFTGSFGEDTALKDVKGLGILSLGRADNEVFGAEVETERMSLGLGVEGSADLGERARVFGQIGGMATKGEISVDGVSEDDTQFGPFFGLGFELLIHEKASFFVSYRPLEPTLDFDGSDVDTRTLTVGVGFSL